MIKTVTIKRRIGKMRQRRFVEEFKRIIPLLGKIDGRKSLTDLSRILGIRPNTVSDYLYDLKEIGLVELTFSDKAPRKLIPRLTPLGECIVECLKKHKSPKQHA